MGRNAKNGEGPERFYIWGGETDDRETGEDRVVDSRPDRKSVVCQQICC